MGYKEYIINALDVESSKPFLIKNNILGTIHKVIFTDKGIKEIETLKPIATESELFTQLLLSDDYEILPNKIPSFREDYYYLGVDGFIHTDEWNYDDVDLARYSMGNVFTTREASLFKKDYICSKFNKLRKECDNGEN